MTTVELQAFIRRTDKPPTFADFVSKHKDDIATWSVREPTQVASVLHGLWYEKFKQAILTLDESKSVRKVKYNILIWNSIMAKCERKRALVDTYQEAGLDVLTAAASTVRNEAIRLFEPGSSRPSCPSAEASRELASSFSRAATTPISSPNSGSSSGPSSSPTSTSAIEIPINQSLFSCAKKKFLKTLTASDKAYLDSLFNEGGTIPEKLTIHSVQLLRKNKLTQAEEETLKLLLSMIVNLIDEPTYFIMKGILGDNTVDLLDLEATPISHTLDDDCVLLLDNIIDNHHDIESLLIRVQEEKLTLLRSQDRRSAGYNMIQVLSIALDYMDNQIDSAASEQTFYRRFAALLDFVFDSTNIGMLDGEVISMSTKQAMQASDCDSSFGRRIDLLLKVKNTKVELCSNEWKNQSSTELKLKQQCKNIRSNCAILSTLYLQSQGNITSTVAGEFVGNIGYLYKLEYKPDVGVFVVTPVDTVCLPGGVEDLVLFKKTIKLLFSWRLFLDDLAKKMRPYLLQDAMSSMIRHQERNTAVPPLPRIFFSPTIKRGTKRRQEAD